MASSGNGGPTRDWRNMTRTIAHYERIEQIGEGTYGQVYKAKCLDTGRIVALKKIRLQYGGYWGMPPTVIREIKILKRLFHPTLVSMLEVVSSKGVEYLEEHDEVPERKSSKSSNDRIDDKRESYKGNIYLVLEYVSHDLTGLMDVAYRFSQVQVKCIFRQLLEALQYMHEQKYIHRDIKSSNILIDSHFRVKLADFGLARCIEPPILENIHDRGTVHEFTNKVITLWYRPPEILLGATRYGPAVDMFSAGCILAELILGRPLFTGKTEMEQLQQIFDLLGTPTADSWEGFSDLKLMRTGEVTIEKQRRPKLRDKYGHKMPTAAMNLIEKLLELDPNKRLTASRALTSRYFLSEPRAPERPEDLGTLQLGQGGGHFHEFQTKKKRREAKALAKKASNEARASGLSEKQAEAEYEAVYRECMKKVAEEGNKALITEVERREMERRDKEKIDEDMGIDATEEKAAKRNGHDRSERSDKRDSKKERSDQRDDKKEHSDRKRHRSDDEDRENRGKDDRKRRRESKEEQKPAKKETKPDERKPEAAPVAPDSSLPSLGEAREGSFPADGMAKEPEKKQGREPVAGFSPDPNEAARKAEKPRKRTSSREGSRRERGDSRERKDKRRDRSRSRERRDRDESRERRHHKASKRDRDRDSSRHKGRDKDHDRHEKDSSKHDRSHGRHDKDRDRRDRDRERHDKDRSKDRKKSSRDDRRERHSPDRKSNRRDRTGDDRYGPPPPDDRRDGRERENLGIPDPRDRNREHWNGPPREQGGRNDRSRQNEWDGPPPDRRGPAGHRDDDRNSRNRGPPDGPPLDRRGPPERRDGGGRNSPGRYRRPLDGPSPDRRGPSRNSPGRDRRPPDGPPPDRRGPSRNSPGRDRRPLDGPPLDRRGPSRNSPGRDRGPPDGPPLDRRGPSRNSPGRDRRPPDGPPPDRRAPSRNSPQGRERGPRGGADHYGPPPRRGPPNDARWDGPPNPNPYGPPPGYQQGPPHGARGPPPPGYRGGGGDKGRRRESDRRGNDRNNNNRPPPRRR